MITVVPCSGNKKVLKGIKGIAKNTKKGISKAFLQVGPAIVKTERKFMRRKKSGREYLVYWSKSGKRLSKGRRHRASAKGQSPGIVSGELYRSLGYNRNTFRYLTIGSTAKHAQWLEPSPDGSWSGYLDRPFKLNAIRLNNRDIQNHLYQDIETSVVGGHK